MRARLISIAIATIVGLLAQSAMAAKPFVATPQLDGKNTNVQLRFVRYTGGSSGEMIVDVKNQSKTTTQFEAKGLFFVPDGDPEKAPQRLGAAGPFFVEGHPNDPRTQVPLKPGEVKRLRLQVFCLDSHRSSPGSRQGFRMAKKRLPKKLRRTIASRTAADQQRAPGATRAAKVRNSKSAVQSSVWRTRNSDWVKLEGERKNEGASKGNLDNRQVIQRRR